MIIIHENAPFEAKLVAKEAKKHFGIETGLVEGKVNELFFKIKNFSGESYMINPLTVDHLKRTLGAAFMVLTPRDLYNLDSSQGDDWILGGQYGLASIVSLARMKTQTGVPSEGICIDLEKYSRRVSLLCLHEIAHDLINANKPSHLKDAYWVNAATGYRQRLGMHCLDNRCLVYETVDVVTPTAEQGWLLFEDEEDSKKGTSVKRFDAGIDDNAQRLYPELFCERCRAVSRVPAEYLKV